jgi:hypothetical protein
LKKQIDNFKLLLVTKCFLLSLVADYALAGLLCDFLSIAPLFKVQIGLAQFSNILLVAENANTDLPPIGFCNEFLLGSKYNGA